MSEMGDDDLRKVKEILADAPFWATPGSALDLTCRHIATIEAELTALRARLAQAESKSDAEMERVKACEHIALGDDGWQVLRNLCPSTAAVAWLRDQLVVAEAENAVMVSALKGLVDAVANMRVPQNVVDAGLQINVTLGPAYEAAVAALSRHGNPEDPK